MLAAGPWTWPVDDDSHERRLVPAGPPLEPAVGTTLGVTVVPGDRAATIWMIDGRPGDRRDGRLEPSAIETWKVAALALPRAIPLVWGSLREAHAIEPRLVWVDTWAIDGLDGVPPERSVTGTSFGLAFVLVLASRLVALSLPGDLLCSVAIDAEGRVAEVGGLVTKLRAIAAIAPGVSRVMVAVSQEDEAKRAIEQAGPDAARLRIVGVKSVGHALEVAFGERRLSAALARAGENPASRAELTRSFFALALQGRGEFVDWTPVERAAALASHWPGLDVEQRYMLEFAHAVAARHERNEGAMSLPTAELLARWPTQVSCQVVTHAVQQAADAGAPDIHAIRALAEAYRAPSVPKGFLPQLKLEGALARLDAVTGQAPRALRTQLDLAALYLEAFLPGEASFPLSEAYRLAGVLGDSAAFRNCEALRDLAHAAGGLGLEGSPYVALARARAAVLLGKPEDCGAEQTLRAMAADTRLAAHVRWGAARWAHRLAAEDAMAELGAIRAALASAADDADAKRGHAARVQLELLRLDEALRGHDVARANAAVDVLRGLEGGIVGLLEAWAPAAELPAHVARFYPY